MHDRTRDSSIAALALALTSVVAGSEPEVVSFDEAIRRAVQHNHDIARSVTAILSAEGLLGRARAQILPTFELYASEARVDEQIAFGGNVVQPQDQLTAGATAAVPVLAAARWAARTQAEDQVEVARAEAADVRRQVSVATAQAYLAVIGARRQVEVDERARDNAGAQHEYAQTRFEGGAGSRLDALRAADVLATNEVLVERSYLALRLSQEALGVLIAADGPVDAGEEPVFDVPEEQAAPDLGARTDLILRTKQVDAADRVLEDSWKDWIPEVFATFDPRYVDPAGTFQESSSWRAALEARFPLYLGGERKVDRQIRRAALDAAKIDLDQAELRARAEVRSARDAVEAAERALVHAVAAAEHANAVLSITDTAFRAGARTNIELVDAQRRARDAETAVARAEDVLRQAKLELRDALGLFGNE